MYMYFFFYFRILCSNEKASGTTPPRWKRNFLYRNGTEQVILTCGNVTRTQRRDQFQWWFRFSQDSAWVQISRLQNKREIRRVDSALVLSRVHTEDVGLYICTEGAQELVQVHLGVVTGRYHLGLIGAGERCLFPPQSPPGRGCTKHKVQGQKVQP